MDDPDNTVSDCYVACVNTGAELEKVLDFSTYSTGIFTTSEATDKGATAAIKYMTQISKCRMVEFLGNLDNRASDLSFVSGMGVNFVLQAVMKDNSQLYLRYDEIMDAWNNSPDATTRWQKIGLSAQSFLTKSFAYSAPDRAASRPIYV